MSASSTAPISSTSPSPVLPTRCVTSSPPEPPVSPGARAASAAKDASRIALASAKLRTPVAPGKVLCCGVNYKSHAEENPNAVMPIEPFFFAKLPSSVAGPEDEIAIPAMSKQVDYEVEFAVVIGKRIDRAERSRGDAGGLRLHAPQRRLRPRRPVQGRRRSPSARTSTASRRSALASSPPTS